MLARLLTAGVSLAALALVSGCGSAEPGPASANAVSSEPQPMAARPAPARPRYRQGLDAVDDARQLTDLVNSRQAHAMSQLDAR